MKRPLKNLVFVVVAVACVGLAACSSGQPLQPGERPTGTTRQGLGEAVIGGSCSGQITIGGTVPNSLYIAANYGSDCLGWAGTTLAGTCGDDAYARRSRA
jgi:hypothetical protein